MKRSALTSLAACLTLGAPLLAFSPSAAVAATLKPSGPALVHVGGDGQTAFAKKRDRHLFTIKAPADAVVDWVGLVEGKGDRSGTYTPSQLVKAWKALGHRAGVGVQSTITWFPEGSSDMSFRSVRVSDPRINSNGELVITARVNDAAHSGLPRALPDFGINISRADKSVRYPTVWNGVAITTGLGFQVSVGGDQSGSVTYQYSQSYKPGDPPPTTTVPFLQKPANCTSSALTVSFSGSKNYTYQFPQNNGNFICNGYTIRGTPATHVVYTVIGMGITVNASVLPCWDVTWNGGASAMCSPVPFSWSYSPN